MLFKKEDASEEEQQFFLEILDIFDTEMVVVRGRQCKSLYLNAPAQQRMAQEGLDAQSCKTGYGSMFARLCNHCPNAGRSRGEQFDLEDDRGRIFSVACHEITWMDGKPATALLLRDVDRERRSEQRLYSLAYLDQLTAIPNRQKLMEQFRTLSENTEKNKYYGVIALFDMDNFKSVNDTYGHNTGDIMLKRLAEHLGAIPEFSGHLYRLGGDEFVLFYVDTQDKFQSEADYREHYRKLLRGAFYSYTMPNIELSCTISMGVAFYPSDGTATSDLLRKADIALYEAKSMGRNRMVFFESNYDSAKKFNDYFINIQPIMTEDGKTMGYSLADSDKKTPKEDDELNLNEFDRAIEALVPSDLMNEVRYFINYSNKLATKSVLNNVPKNKFIIQIPVSDKLSKVELETYRGLRELGYSIALVDLRAGKVHPELMELAQYCKFAPGTPMTLLQKKVIDAYPGHKFIATGIDTLDLLSRAKSLGFRLFQGNYFNQPDIVKKEKDIDPLKANYYRLLKLTSTDDYVDFTQIAEIISCDVALSYKLLRILNSAAVGLRNRMSSIPMAVSYLGEEALKKWIALLALRGVATDKPLELVRMSLIRARFGELLAPHLIPRRDPKRAFMAGMFSLLHIALEKTPEELMEEIPMEEDIRDSLLTEEGFYSDLLKFFTAYEYSNWDEVSVFSQKHDLRGETIYHAYLDAVRWYNDLAEQ